MRKGTRVAVGAVIAAGLGYVTGLLTAPKSGKETRQDIHDKAVQAKRESEVKLKELNAELSSLILRAKNAAKSTEEATRNELHKAVEKAVVAKDKAREILSAFHEGESHDKDLQKAITDVHKAIEHLKKYIDKNPPAGSAKPDAE